MRSKASIACVMVGMLILGGSLQAHSKKNNNDKKMFNKIVDRYFDFYFKNYPTAGTDAGFHQYDDQLEDSSKDTLQAQISELKKFESTLQTVDPKKLDLGSSLDYEVLENHIRASLLDLETLRGWQTNPDQYGSIVSESIYGLVSRNFAPLEDRLRSVIEREKQVPKVFQAARQNLKNPPKVYTEIALEQLEGTLDFFKKDVPAVFKEVRNKQLQAEFETAHQKAISELESYHAFLKEKILPASKGDFRLGEELYRKKLLYEEMIDIPLDRLLKMGFENLRENQKWFQETAAKIDPKKSSSEILTEMMKDHPSADHLLDEVRTVTNDLKVFLVDKKIVTLPSPVSPIVEETPPFARALYFASMEAPGPYETKAKEAYYHVTPAESDWSAEKIEEHLQQFNRPVIVSTSAHETYPGHYVQFLWQQKVRSKVRKLLGCNSNIEGWAHYTEQMTLDEGYGNGDSYLRLGQLQDALLRNARFIVGIQMHTGHMSYEEAVDFFMKEGYQSRTNAEREVRRGTIEPTYMYYTYGKLEILKLREDYKKVRGDKFSLSEFHDEFLKQGPAPIPLIRRALAGALHLGTF